MAVVTASLANGVLTITGTDGADNISVSQVNGVIKVGGISDSFAVNSVKKIVIDAGNGNDVIHLDSQAVAGQQGIVVGAWVFARDGNDKIWGGEGADFIDGGLGNDTIYGGGGGDRIFGDAGDDVLYGNAGADFMIGGDGNDKLYGGDGDDTLDGSRGTDNLFGDAGNDKLYDDATGNTRDGGAGTNTNVNDHTGWFDMNLVDAMVRSVARAAGDDGTLDRADWMATLRSAEADGAVSAAEIADFKTLVNAASKFKTPEAVANLAGKVVNGSTANATYAGASLGNLAVGSSGDQLEKLIGKWFLGNDRPTGVSSWGPTYAYRAAAGNLFVGGASYEDVNQGGIGDCYFLAALGEVALKSPTTIQSMFTDNGDGTFAVRFYNKGTADYVTVDRMLPTDSYGRFVFAGMGKLASNTSNELWVALAEKAYVQLCQANWVRGSSVTTYVGISGGYISEALAQITGKKTTLGNRLDETALVNAVKAGAMIGVASKSSGVAAGVVSGHAYALVGYDAATKKFTLFNPWGVNNHSAPGKLTLTFNELAQSFSYWDRTV